MPQTQNVGPHVSIIQSTNLEDACAAAAILVIEDHACGREVVGTAGRTRT